MRIFFLILTLFICMGASSCSGVKLAPDNVMAAVIANDSTVVIEGCGSQPVVGYTYCRVTEGDTADMKLRLHVPPSLCASKPCVNYKVFFPNGEPSLGGDVPENQSMVEIKWEDLIKKKQFGVGERGFWPILITVKWIDKDERERTSYAEGEIRLRVLRKGYIALNEINSDSNFVWSWTNNKKQIFKYTTGMRAYTGQVK